MIRILIDEVSPNNDRRGNRRKRKYTIEILNYLDDNGEMRHSAWLHDADGIVIKRATLRDVVFPESNSLLLAAKAFDALRASFEAGQE